VRLTREALAQPGRRRVRGITACAIFTALLLTAANLRKIRTWPCENRGLSVWRP